MRVRGMAGCVLAVGVFSGAGMVPVGSSSGGPLPTSGQFRWLEVAPSASALTSQEGSTGSSRAQDSELVTPRAPSRQQSIIGTILLVAGVLAVLIAASFFAYRLREASARTGQLRRAPHHRKDVRLETDVLWSRREKDPPPDDTPDD